MSQEQNIVDQLINKFGYLQDKVKIQRQRRMYCEVALVNFEEVFAYAIKDLGFAHLCTITGLDEQDNIGIIYHLAREDGIMLNLKTALPKSDPILKSIIERFPSAEIYEREMVDLLGVKVEGLPEGYRYPLVDDWPKGQYPLRKDWKLDTGGN